MNTFMLIIEMIESPDLETGETYTLASVIDLNRKINSVRDDIRASFA